MSDVDVIVAGAGPAGRSLARACTLRGLRVALVDPEPARAWPQTFGAWADELPAGMPSDTTAASMSDIEAHAVTATKLARTYRILDTAVLQRRLSSPAPARVVSSSAVSLRQDDVEVGLTTEDGTDVTASLAIDATGSGRHLLRLTGPAASDPGRQPAAEQTAVGVIVEEPAGFVPAFMDWRQDHGAAGWPTFLYAVRLGGGRVLLEETALARRPGLPLDELRRRLHTRLDDRGIQVPSDAVEERVRIRVDVPPTTGSGRVVPFGAAAPLIHPASGYSLAASLSLATSVADAIAGAVQRGGDRSSVRAVRQAIWSPEARLVHRLRARGLEALLALPADDIPVFFEAFFRLPPRLQRAYLSGRDDAPALATAMVRMFASVDAPIRGHLMRWALSSRAAPPER